MSLVSHSSRKSKGSSDDNENIMMPYDSQMDYDRERGRISERTRRSVTVATNNLVANIIIQSAIWAGIFIAIMFEDWFLLKVFSSTESKIGKYNWIVIYYA